MKKVIALLIADIHLSSTAPVARSGEPDWYAAQGRVLDQLRTLQRKNGGCPIVCAGDVFDRWNSSPELINWVATNLSGFPGEIWVIPGQHDLPHHNYDELNRSAFDTLCFTGRVKQIPPDSGVWLQEYGLDLVGFPWGVELHPEKEELARGIRLAVVHRYVWMSGYEYKGAPNDGNIHSIARRLKGYTHVVFGDNHRGFQLGSFYNCGCLIPRKSDERKLKPSVGAVFSDGSVVRIPLDCSQDQWLEENDPRVEIGERIDAADFLDGLRGLEWDSLNVREWVKRYLDRSEISQRVRETVLDALGE